MATDLNTILKAKKVEDQFAQYFMYQLMVGVTYIYQPTSKHDCLTINNSSVV